MAEVAVRQGVGPDFEADNDCVDLAHGADTGVVNDLVDDDAGEGQGEEGVKGVDEGDAPPCVVELFAILLVLGVIVATVVLFPEAQGCPSTIHCDSFDKEGHEEMAWYE